MEVSRVSSDRLPRSRLVVAPLAVWLVMAVLAVLNGIVRETLLVGAVGEHPGHVLSTLVLVVVIVVVAGAFFASTDADYRPGELLAIGVAWTVMTVGFEFLVGFVEGTPVSATLGQYDVAAGQVWILVPVTLLVAPLVLGSSLRE